MEGGASVIEQGGALSGFRGLIPTEQGVGVVVSLEEGREPRGEGSEEGTCPASTGSLVEAGVGWAQKGRAVSILPVEPRPAQDD